MKKYRSAPLTVALLALYSIAIAWATKAMEARAILKEASNVGGNNTKNAEHQNDA